MRKSQRPKSTSYWIGLVQEQAERERLAREDREEQEAPPEGT